MLFKLILLAGIVIAFRFSPLGKPPILIDLSLEASGKLELGYTEQEIAAIVGGPAGDYRTDKSIGHLFAVVGTWPDLKAYTKKVWLTDQYALEVWFGPNLKAVAIRQGIGFGPPSWAKRLWLRITQ